MISQCDAILSALRRGEIVTPESAYRMCGTHALHSRISELRERGHSIDCQLVETDGGKSVGKYTLSALCATEKIAPAPEELASAWAPTPIYDRKDKLIAYAVGVGPGWPADQDHLHRGRR